jgi:hypothetical protein
MSNTLTTQTALTFSDGQEIWEILLGVVCARTGTRNLHELRVWRAALPSVPASPEQATLKRALGDLLFFEESSSKIIPGMTHSAGECLISALRALVR